MKEHNLRYEILKPKKKPRLEDRKRYVFTSKINEKIENKKIVNNKRL